MNLNKFTKAELISKFKKLESKNSNSNNNNQSILKNIIEKILLFKNILLKLTLISLLIRIFRKYSIIRKIWVLINTIAMSIFGISLIDIYATEFLSNLINEISMLFNNLLSNFSFLFKKNKEIISEVPTNIESRLKWIDKETTRSEQSNEESSGNIEIDRGINENSNKKYYFIAGLLILACLSWYYFDDVKPIGMSTIEWLRKLKSRRDDPGNNGGDNFGNGTNIRDNISEHSVETQNLFERIKNLRNVEFSKYIKERFKTIFKNHLMKIVLLLVINQSN